MDPIAQVFKAYDIRGKVGTQLTPEFTEKVGRAMARWLPEAGTVAVGRDMRPDSAALAAGIVAGLRAGGRNVQDIGEVTSDMIYFAVGDGNLAGGLMVTASHNPGNDNGIKLCAEGARPIGESTGLLEIRDLVIANDFTDAPTPGTVEDKDVAEGWVEHVLSFIEADKLKPLKIAVDAGNGMAGKIFPELEPYVPFEVTELYFDLDGTFPNHIANPLIPENLVDLQKVVAAEGSDAGLAFDGDGDRAVLIDENGLPLSGTVVSALLAEYFLAKHPGATILLNAICGKAAVDAVENNGGKVVRTRVGHSFIKDDMRTHDGLLACEHSGHYFFKDNYQADSGLIAAVITLFILSESGKKLSELAAPYRQAYLQITETNFEIADKAAMIAKIAEAFPDAEKSTLDGLTVSFGDSWLNARPSNTEPLLRLNAEAKTQEQLDSIVAKVTALLKS